MRNSYSLWTPNSLSLSLHAHRPPPPRTEDELTESTRTHSAFFPLCPTRDFSTHSRARLLSRDAVSCTHARFHVMRPQSVSQRQILPTPTHACAGAGTHSRYAALPQGVCVYFARTSKQKNTPTISLYFVCTEYGKEGKKEQLLAILAHEPASLRAECSSETALFHEQSTLSLV